VLICAGGILQRLVDYFLEVLAGNRRAAQLKEFKILYWEVTQPFGEKGGLHHVALEPEKKKKLEVEFSVLGTVEAMSLRVRTGPPIANRVVGREMRELHARLEAMEAMQRRTPVAEDVSDVESEEVEVEEATGEDVAEECLLKVIVKLGAREKMDIPMYEGNLDVEELLDWIRSMDKYFDYEDVEEGRKVIHVVTRLKGHAALRWDELQVKRRSKGKQKIKNWDRMVAKLKAKFIPRDYQINLFRKLQNLRQRGMTMKEYMEEFYRLNIRTGQREKDDEKVARYINGLRYEIQDEISMMIVRTMEDAIKFH
jgi:hypothetical protein